MHLVLEQKALTQQSLSPRLQQSNYILQLAAPSLQQLVQQQLHQNPFLEAMCEDEEEVEVVEAEEALTASPSISPTVGDHLDALQNIPQHTSLEAIVSLHLACEPLCSPEIHQLALVLLDALESDGYLRQEFDELLPDSIELIPLAWWQEALILLQKVAPAGIGARSLQECLLLQLERLSDLSSTDQHALQCMITDHLPLVASHQLQALAKQLDLSIEHVKRLITYLTRLDPKPGHRYLHQAGMAITPDVYVLKTSTGWRIKTNRQAFPRLSVHQYYGELLQSSILPTQHPAVKEWQDAQWLVKSIERRHQTIVEVTKIILRHQRAFFNLGEEALQPLLISDLAQELDLHESTISRATSNKFMSTPNGVFSFRHFFSRELDTQNGGRCSTRMVKLRLKELIEQENPLHPLSDVHLHQQLNAEGINIAKRTITKYRLQLGLANANERRRKYAVSA